MVVPFIIFEPRRQSIHKWSLLQNKNKIREFHLHL
jgi:hypothetical protein